MTRLPFRLPESAPRTTWASAHAREVWEPRIAAVSRAWLNVERESVAAGVRPSALQNVSPDDLPDLMKQLAPLGLIVLPLGKSARAQGYQSASQAITGEWDYRCAITTPSHAAAWAQAWADSDDDAIGRLLGTPKCCRDFFARVWKLERWMDTTIPQYGTEPAQSGLNMLWRWHGVRPVSHLPCSADCVETHTLAHKCQQLLPLPARTWHRDILSWPVRYTSLHGIAEITTPITRSCVTTDALAEKVEVRYLGYSYPAEGAKGTDFPHKNEAPQPVTIRLAPSISAHNNGFTTPAAMDAAHRALLHAAPGLFNTVLDLGCGDGTLLSKIPAKRRVGVEADSGRARYAQKHLDRVVTGDCQDKALIERLLIEERPDLIIAQRSRNPPDTLPGQRVLSYSYESDAEPPRLIGV